MRAVAARVDENVVCFKRMSLRLRGGFTLACNTSEAGSRRRWPESAKFLRFLADARRKPLRRRAVRPRRAAHRWLDAAHRAASNHLRGGFSRQRHA
jgi:hypothetical protein